MEPSTAISPGLLLGIGVLASLIVSVAVLFVVAGLKRRIMEATEKLQESNAQLMALRQELHAARKPAPSPAPAAAPRPRSSAAADETVVLKPSAAADQTMVIPRR